MRALNRRCGLLLGIYLLTIVQCAADCTVEDFKRGSDFHESFDLSNMSPNYANGDVVRLKCQVGYRGFVRMTCTEHGWVKKGDICRAKPCGHPGDVPFADFVLVKGDDYVFGSQVRYTCHSGYYMTSDSDRRNCLLEGWDGHLPVCELPQSCGSPPSLDDGDFTASTGTFRHNSSVQYQCQSKYTMQGGPYKTCLNGEWTGEIKCLKPCNVNPDLMEPNKIQFTRNEKNKLYAPHEDHISFTCRDGATHDGAVPMRQICLDGVMNLPKCV